jgi:hypothetical protein
MVQRLIFSSASVLQAEVPEGTNISTVFKARTDINLVRNGQDVILSCSVGTVGGHSGRAEWEGRVSADYPKY